MSFDEKLTWISAVLTLVTYGTYVILLLWSARGIPMSQAPFVGPMVWTLGGGILASILGCIALAAIPPRDCGKRDQRDEEIHRYGEYIGQSFLVMGGLAALVLCLVKANHFWIANVIYLGFVLSALLSSGVKLVAYRRGFHAC